jgi:ROS/MUCR transcriptional regulator protein
MEGTGRLFLSKEAVNGHVVPNALEACQEGKGEEAKMSETTKNYLELTGDIVSAYVAANNIQRSEIPGLIADVNSALRNIGQPTPEPVKAEPPVPIKQTIKPDYIISLEDGKRYRSLKRHLSAHGLADSGIVTATCSGAPQGIKGLCRGQEAATRGVRR